MKKISFIISFSVFSLLLNSSCGDNFLEKQPQGQYSPAVLKTPRGVEGALVGAYALLDGFGIISGFGSKIIMEIIH
jgi:hypothetical protein